MLHHLCLGPVALLAILAPCASALQQAKLTAAAAAAGDEFGSAVHIEGDRLVIGAPRSDSAGAPSAQTSFEVLMIGNSYTQGQGGVPLGGVTDDVQGLFDADPVYSASVIERAEGSWSLLTHATDPTTLSLITDSFSFQWDVIVLQEQSMRPARAMKFGGADLANLDAGGPELIDLIRLHQPQARIVLYDTWARQPGNQELVDDFNDDPTEMQSFTNAGYDRIRANPPAWDHQSVTSIARVGDAWAGWFLTHAPGGPEGLHAGDGSHQNNRGSYLAAAVIFETITGRSSVGNTFQGSYLGGVTGTIGGTSERLLLQQRATATTGALRMDTGSAFVFERSGSTWTETARLSAVDAQAFDEFGAAVALSADTIVVGAPAAGTGDSGAVYVFVDGPFGWIQQAKLVAADAAAGDGFGGAVAIEGDRVVVGSPGHDVFGFQFYADAGAAYVFVRNGTTWTQEARLVAADRLTGDALGSDVALFGDTLIAGAPTEDGAGVDSGSVYAFVRTGTTWTQQAEFRGIDTTSGDRFGSSLSLVGDRALVGAGSDDGVGLDAGSAYVFLRTGASWAQEAKLTPADPAANDRFGTAVALSVDRALVGSPFDDPAGSDSGSAYVFGRVGASWSQLAKLTANDAVFADGFGAAAGLDGDTALVGTPLDNGIGADSGSVYVDDIAGLFPQYESFCAGDGGNQLGCTPCPCGNDAAPGANGGCLNEASRSALLTVTGTARISADSLRFELFDANSNTFAVLTSGAARAPATPANPCFGLDSGVTSAQLNGLRCVVQQVQRHGARPTNSDGDAGVTTNGWGPPSGPVGGLIAQGGFVAGQTRHFQAIYRETPFAGCLAEQNTSQAISVTILP